MAICLSSALALSGSACKSASGPDVDAVRNYLEGLPSALHADTLGGIRPYATEDQTESVRLYVSKVLNDDKQRMDATLEGVTFEAVDREGSDSTVGTHEEWKIRYLDKDSARLAKTESYAIDVRYHVVQQGGKWLVAGVEETNRTVR